MPICYLDRDGIINHHLPYVGTLERFIWYEEIIEFSLNLKKYNYQYIIITNQSGIDRGYYSIENLLKINQMMVFKFKENGLDIQIRFCPHTPEANCNCRKPKTGMIAHDNRSPKDIFVGDQISDMQCAFNSGVKNRWLISNKLSSKYETRRALNHQDLINNFEEWYFKDIA